MKHDVHNHHNHVEPVRPQTHGSVEDAEVMSGEVVGAGDDEDDVGDDAGGELDGDEMQKEGEEAVVPKLVRDPGEPTAQERAEHEKTHLPYRSWCKFCVMGRGRDLPHRAKDRTDDGCQSWAWTSSSWVTTRWRL